MLLRSDDDNIGQKILFRACSSMDVAVMGLNYSSSQLSKMSEFLTRVVCFDNEEQAKECGDIERSWRGMKYDFRVVAVELNSMFQEKIDHHNGCAQ